MLSVGTELTDGKITDLHGRYLAGELREIGAKVGRVILLPDDRKAFLDELSLCARRFQVVIITGGLGPTSDDLTREVVAACANVDLEFHDDLWAEIVERMTGRGGGAPIPEPNRRQAYIPAGFAPLRNAHGTAPGFTGTLPDGAVVVALPGPPRELRPMFEGAVRGLIRRTFELATGGGPGDELAATAFLTSESALESALQASRRDGVTWGTRVDDTRIAFFLRGSTENARVDMLRSVAEKLGHEHIRRGEVEAAELVFDLLRKRKQTLVLAESCTGGLIAKYITDLPGSSSVLWGGFVVYSNDAKIRSLGVREETLLRSGAVSEAVVLEMAVGAIEKSGATFGVSVSGIAGPEGGTAEKPVGTVWIGVAGNFAAPVSRRFDLRGDRSRIRRHSAVAALLLLEDFAAHAAAPDSNA